MRVIRVLLVLSFLGSIAVGAEVDFLRDVRPILATKCWKCHGASEPEAGLNLTDSRSARQPLSGTTPIVPGSVEQSELWRRVATDDPDERMPPGEQRLTDQELEILRRWIAAGAEWPPHWAYTPLDTPPVPPVAADSQPWCRTPVDRFIAQRLERAELSPSPPADRRTLIHRVYFDLIGLPPTPDEVDAFLVDDSPDAYERLVDRLLSSPRHGERWARHWMDAVHFAETHGHDQDRPREHSWPYRDYLIQSLNDDKPYARFVREQIAGDVLFPDDPQAIIATGLLAAGPWDESSLRDIREDSLDREIARYLDRDDIVTTVLSTFASTTVHCARCHDHKFDPISQREYYSLQAVFAGIDKANRPFDADAKVAARRRELESQRQQIAAWQAAGDPALLRAAAAEELAAWERSVAAEASRWQPLELIEFQSRSGSTLTQLDDGSLLSEGERPDTDVYTIVARTTLKLTALRLDVLADDRLPKNGPGRQDNGNLHLSELVVFAVNPDDPQDKIRLVLVNPRADFDQQGWTIAMALDDDPATAWGIFPEVGKPHHATFQLARPWTSNDPLVLQFELYQLHGGGHLIGRLKLSGSQMPAPAAAVTALPDEVTEVVATPPDERTRGQQLLLAAHFLRQKVESQLTALPEPRMVYCGTNQFTADGSFRPASQPRAVHVLHRGDVTQPLGEAHPGALALIEHLRGEFQLADPSREGERRAALARWLTDPRNGLTWRSIANRVWQHHFGLGLVETPNDFGQMGQPPTNPELLDHLAASLRDEGGLKSLHRRIVTSSVYRQSSRHREDIAARDAGNRLLARMNRRRLDAESFRDALLVASGTLDATMGGPSARQFELRPGVHVTPTIDYLGFDASSPANHRRGVYRFLFRTLPDPFMDALDCPDASQLAPRRNVSNTALQALATLNDKFVIRQSELLAKAIEQSTSDRKGQVVLAYCRLFGRQPDDDECRAVIAYADRHGFANACRFLLNTNEFMFLD